ncbi:MAG: FkbM family methyltransferase [Deltaproteobacteria bacterium]|nr:FkbM family methyltransferase [Deltaproteobacteria bacterium]
MHSTVKHPAAEALSCLLISWQHQLFPENLTRVETSTLAGSMFIHLQQLLKPDLSMEIGAFQADYSKKMRLLFPRIHVAAFEASPDVYRHFKRREQFHKRNIAYLNLAVADINGMASFNLIEENAGLSMRNSLMDRTDLPAQSVSVPAITGDAFVREHPAGNIALWIDVEGAQEKVLTGFRESLERQSVASLFIEVEQGSLWRGQWSDSETIGYLLRFGYVPVLCDAESYAPENQKNQYNIIFARAADINDQFIAFMLEGYKRIIKAMRAE